MTGLTLSHISKQYKDSDRPAVRDISLDVGCDEFLVLLGPSGCGKTTLLRIISGLVRPSEGQVYIDGQDVTALEPQQRGIGMVFQNYAIYPHMSIRKNLTFALEVAHMKRKERTQAVEKVSDILDIGRHLGKKPHMLSGGERQRVAMGRAMAGECKLYLFDEPLSNLDDGLRTRLRPEILSLFHRLHVPFVYVTHDQVDAMTMATRVAVMKNGTIEQLGTPQQIYDQPASLFVASFVGSPKINLIPAAVQVRQGRAVLDCGAFQLDLPQYQAALLPRDGQQVIAGIRPEDLLVSRTGRDLQPIRCVLDRYENLGGRLLLVGDFHGHALRVMAPLSVRAKVGESLELFLDKSKVHLFDAESQVRL